jgi:4-alpha-glucanotransferase
VPLDDAIRAAAEQNGVQQHFWDIFGTPHTTALETNRAILSALGVDCTSEESLGRSLTGLETGNLRRCLPPVLVIGENARLKIPVRSPQELERLELQILTESGENQSISVNLKETRVDRGVEFDGGGWVERVVELSVRLPPGYHEVRAGECGMRLIVAPDSARRPPPGKHAGLGVTLYGLRSARNWGVGDFRDLRDLIDWAVPALHADFIALNPLHAIHNRAPYNTSPYLPTSIFYRNFLYLEIEGVPGYDAVRASFETRETRSEIEQLRATEIVQYERVAAVKRRALDMIFASAPPTEECRSWIRGEGDLLRLYATYCALDEHFHAADPNVWVWNNWPEPYRNPESAEVRDFARSHEREILFHGWVQWLIDQQATGVQKHAREAGMSIGLYHDLALATDRFGSDLWAHRAFYISGARVGSPPDGFAPSGQDWSFPPPDARRHREDGYSLYTESIRKSMRHGGALRIDHVMRLFRLYWIPEGYDAAHGAYVRDRAEDLVRILALESVRNNAVVIGEDLGTVEDEVRRTLAGFGILSYRLLIFEKNDNGFRLPGEYPAQALTSTTTHDLPTVAGFWAGEDIEARLQTGTADRRAYEAQKTERTVDMQRLLNNLLAMNLLPPDHERDAGRIPFLTPALHYAILGYLANTPSVLWLVNQEDITRELRQQNLPGTTDQYPNWSRKMRWSIEELSALQEARDCAAMVRNWIERTGRG